MAKPEISDKDAADAVRHVKSNGGVRAAARATGIPFGTLKRRYHVGMKRAADPRPVIDVEPVIGGRIHATPRVAWGLPSRGAISRYIFTCAQSNTHLHTETWENIQALAAHYGARICVSTFTYDLASYGAASVKRDKKKGEKGEPWYDPSIVPFLLDESVVVAPGLVWCGEMNILPTAVRPLSGLESYTGRKSGIIPHVKFAMQSIASGKYEGTKFNYTTGTVTQRNYVAKKAGLKAEFHHGYGGLLVEVDHNGAWFVRQLNATSEGVICDLTLRAKDGRVTDGHRVEGITWGDIHTGTIDPVMGAMLWGEGGMMDTLKPRFQFLHDVLDFRSRNHHARGNPHATFERHVKGEEDVYQELSRVATFILSAQRNWCETIVVDSNHDNALTRWLREGDYRHDPVNARFFLEAQLQVYNAIYYAARGTTTAQRKRSKNFHLVEWALRRLGELGAKYLRADESFILCRDANGGIECGMHGHRGTNGANASITSFARMGRKSNTGHSHSAGIEDGAYVSGIVGDLDQGYNEGPSSWSHSNIITYETGKRAIQTCWAKKWRA